MKPRPSRETELEVKESAGVYTPARRRSGRVGPAGAGFPGGPRNPGSESALAGWGPTPSVLIKRLQAGLPFAELEDLRASLGLPMDKVAAYVGIPKATLHRRKAVGRLDPDESDRVVRFARLMARAVEVMESEEAARLWLGSPQHGLGGALPLQYARSEVGAREVEDLLGRIEHGVYS